jgi:hypothetical protein
MERKVPSALWIGVAALGAMTLIQLLVGVQKGSGALLVSVILDVVLGAGLLLGHKWAYILTLVIGVGSLIALLGRNAGPARYIPLLNGLVVVPVILSTRFFFPGPPDGAGEERPEPERS